jgi:hypothetical protein
MRETLVLPFLPPTPLLSFKMTVHKSLEYIVNLLSLYLKKKFWVRSYVIPGECYEISEVGIYTYWRFEVSIQQENDTEYELTVTKLHGDETFFNKFQKALDILFRLDIPISLIFHEEPVVCICETNLLLFYMKKCNNNNDTFKDRMSEAFARARQENNHGRADIYKVLYAFLSKNVNEGYIFKYFLETVIFCKMLQDDVDFDEEKKSTMLSVLDNGIRNIFKQKKNRVEEEPQAILTLVKNYLNDRDELLSRSKFTRSLVSFNEKELFDNISPYAFPVARTRPEYSPPITIQTFQIVLEVIMNLIKEFVLERFADIALLDTETDTDIFIITISEGFGVIILHVIFTVVDDNNTRVEFVRIKGLCELFYNFYTSFLKRVPPIEEPDFLEFKSRECIEPIIVNGQEFKNTMLTLIQSVQFIELVCNDTLKQDTKIQKFILCCVCNMFVECDNFLALLSHALGFIDIVRSQHCIISEMDKIYILSNIKNKMDETVIHDVNIPNCVQNRCGCFITEFGLNLKCFL